MLSFIGICPGFSTFGSSDADDIVRSTQVVMGNGEVLSGSVVTDDTWRISSTEPKWMDWHSHG